jgi:hypothetical protein
MTVSGNHFTPAARHSERSEESKGIFAAGNDHARPLGSFAALRMTGLETIPPEAIAPLKQIEVSP